MARYTGPKCKLCRREGMKLFLKGDRCESSKCAISRRDYPPGMHTWRRSKPSEYGLQLREKQKCKRFYGILERQFRLYFREAVRVSGNTGEQLLLLLERRLDNVVFLLGFARSRSEARQAITHGHLTVDGHKVDIPSFIVATGQSIGVRKRDKSTKLIKERLEGTRGRQMPQWLGRNDQTPEGKIITLPTREDVSLQVHEQLIVELCSK